MLETVRLRLRRLVASDVDELARTFSDPAVMRLVGAGVPLRRDEIEAMIEQSRSGSTRMASVSWESSAVRMAG